MFFNTPAFCKNHNTNINIRKSELLNGLWHRVICKIFVLQDFDGKQRRAAIQFHEIRGIPHWLGMKIKF